MPTFLYLILLIVIRKTLNNISVQSLKTSCKFLVHVILYFFIHSIVYLNKWEKVLSKKRNRGLFFSNRLYIVGFIENKNWVLDETLMTFLILRIEHIIIWHKGYVAVLKSLREMKGAKSLFYSLLSQFLYIKYLFWKVKINLVFVVLKSGTFFISCKL